MFGNLMGWIISLVLAAMGAFAGFELMQMALPTAPTGFAATIKPLDLTSLANDALQPMNDPRDDAGDLYRQAAADYDAHRDLYEQMKSTRDFDEAQAAELKGFSDIVSATHSSSMHLFSNHPEEVVGYETSVATLDKLGEVVTAMENAAALAKLDKNYEVAGKYANAIASLGYRLYKERAANIELDAGENYLGAGLHLLEDIAKAEKTTDKLQKLSALDAQRKQEFDQAITPVRQVILSQDQQGIGIHAGDMFQIAQDPSIDRVWRVEAIRRLARLRYNAENAADQKKAPKVLNQLADNTKEDLVIRTAAAKARDMTSYENQGGR